jgi:signal peptidase I
MRHLVDDFSATSLEEYGTNVGNKFLPEIPATPNATLRSITMKQSMTEPTSALKNPVGEAPPSAQKGNLVAWMRDVVVSLAVSVFIIVFVYQPVKVEGTSMMPGLDDQERIFINKFVYNWESVERGDVVVFRYPNDPRKSYIKRVVGVAGDHVKIDDGRVYVNGNLLDEPYVLNNFRDDRSCPEIIVPPHSYFVLGDHRNLSSDSRDFGSIPERTIYGKAVFVYWPMDKVGKLR